jgi:DNA-binding FadR family transcriptional regulator
VSGRRHRDIVDALLARMLAGDYEAGGLLPKETDLAAEFAVNRGTAREALRALEERNVVVVRHGRGAIVQPQATWDLLDPVVLAAVRGSRRRRGLEAELREALRIAEAELAALAAERIGDAAAAALAAAGAGPELFARIAAAAGNRPLAALTARLRRAAAAPPLDAGAAGAIVDAVAARDPAAARAAVVRALG